MQTLDDRATHGPTCPCQVYDLAAVEEAERHVRDTYTVIAQRQAALARVVTR